MYVSRIPWGNQGHMTLRFPISIFVIIQKIPPHYLLVISPAYSRKNTNKGMRENPGQAPPAFAKHYGRV